MGILKLVSRPFLRAFVVVLAVTVSAPHLADAGSTGAERPNILLIVAHDLGYADLGIYGSDIRTPNIDQLAREGVRFTQFHSSPMCAPTRAMLLSGNNMGRPDSFVSCGPAWAEAGSAPFRLYKGFTTQGGLVASMIVAGPGVTQQDVISHAYVTVMDVATRRPFTRKTT